MNVTATDNTAAMIATAQAIRNLNSLIFRHAVERKIFEEQSRVQAYFEKAYTKAKLIKGTNVDLYI